MNFNFLGFTSPTYQRYTLNRAPDQNFNNYSFTNSCNEKLFGSPTIEEIDCRDERLLQSYQDNGYNIPSKHCCCMSNSFLDLDYQETIPEDNETSEDRSMIQDTMMAIDNILSPISSSDVQYHIMTQSPHYETERMDLSIFE